VSMKIFFLLLMIAPLSVFAQDSLKTKQLEEVVVTGQFEPQSLSQSVYQVRTITSDVIKMRNATNLQGVLNTELGIRFSNDLTLGTTDVSIMGMSGQDVKILLDGVPLLDRGATRESLNQIDMNTVERVEIVEGPMSVVYGSDALAGVINIITKKGVKNNKPVSVSARIQEETAGKEYNAGSAKGVHIESVYANWQNKKFSAGAGITRNNFGGWQGNSTGRVKDWMPKNQWLAMSNVGYATNRFNILYRLNYLYEDLISAGAPSNNVASDQDYITNRFTHQLQANWDISSKWSFNAVSSYQDYSRRTRSTLYDVTTDRVTLNPNGSQDKAIFSSTTFRGTFLYKMNDKVSFQPGVDLNFDKGMGDRIDKERSIGDYALFVSSEIKPWSFLNVRPGLRFIHNTVYDAPPVIPSINVKAKLSSTMDLRAAYARGFRSPALRELYFYFFDSNHSIQGNPDLKAEYSNSFSTSLTWRAVSKSAFAYTTTLGIFYNEFKDMITLAYDPANPSIYTYLNVSKYKTAGATLNNVFRYKTWKATLGYAHIGVYNDYSEDDSSLPQLLWTPEVNSSISYQFTKTNTTLSIFYKYTGKRSSYENVTGTIHLAQQQEFHWLDFTASQRISKLLTVNAGAKNLCNITRLQNTSQDVGEAHSTGGPVPMSYGRSYFIALNFQLN